MKGNERNKYFPARENETKKLIRLDDEFGLMLYSVATVFMLENEGVRIGNDQLRNLLSDYYKKGLSCRNHLITKAEHLCMSLSQEERTKEDFIIGFRTHIDKVVTRRRVGIHKDSPAVSKNMVSTTRKRINKLLARHPDDGI